MNSRQCPDYAHYFFCGNMKVAVAMVTEIVKMFQKYMDLKMCFNLHIQVPVSTYFMILHLDSYLKKFMPDQVVQSVTCLTADTYLTADSGVAISLPARSHTFLEIDHEIISTAIHLPSADSRRVVVSYKYVHKVLVNFLVKLAQEKSVAR